MRARVRFVDSEPTNGTTAAPTDRLNQTIKKHFSDAHGKFLDFATQTATILAPVTKANNKYYMPTVGERLTRCKLPALINKVAETILKDHTETMEKLQRKLIQGLQARSATVATVSDCKEIAAAEITAKSTQLKQTLHMQIHDTVLQHLAGLKVVEVDAARDCVLIGDNRFNVSKRGVLTQDHKLDRFLTRSLPETFQRVTTNPHTEIPETLQVIVGTALLCNIAPQKLIVNSNSVQFTEQLLAIGGDLVTSIGAKQPFSDKALKGDRIVIIDFNPKLRLVLKKTEKVRGLIVINNPKRETIDVEGYHILTTEKRAISAEWLTLGASPGLTPETVPRIGAQKSEDVVAEAVLEIVKQFVGKNQWSHECPNQTRELRLVLPELKEMQQTSLALDKERVAAALITLGFRVNRPTNRLTVAFQVPRE